MQLNLETFKEQFCQIRDTDQNAFRLFIVGTQLRGGTASVYDECNPAELVVEGEVQDWLLNVTQPFLSNLLEYELVNMSEADDEGSTLKRFISLENLNQLNEWANTITRGHGVSNASELINREGFKPKALIAKFQIGETPIYFLKVLNEGVLLKRKTILTYDVGRGRYIIEDGRNKKLYLDEQWDGIIFENNVVLYHENKILSLFKYYEKFREAAERVVEQIGDLDILSDGTDLGQFIESQVMLQKKLARAADYEFETISRERIVELIQEGTIQLNLNDEGKIECTTKEEARIVVDVILDNFVTSLITENKYRARNKSKI
ncbi:Kiwa anti-phage protein KwaB-like domain-containing protein [Bacillus sp. RC252]|uniref:Kiwa anti-phage protein KwaB-like domain-containing protein n=1 Tax=Bacillus sp. RC252 TaxID=3156289 RepID=UPI0038357BE4